MNKAIFWDLQKTLGGDAAASIEFFEPYPFAKEALKLGKIVLSLSTFRDTWSEFNADIIADNALEAVKKIIHFQDAE